MKEKLKCKTTKQLWEGSRCRLLKGSIAASLFCSISKYDASCPFVGRRILLTYEDAYPQDCHGSLKHGSIMRITVALPKIPGTRT